MMWSHVWLTILTITYAYDSGGQPLRDQKPHYTW